MIRHLFNKKDLHHLYSIDNKGCWNWNRGVNIGGYGTFRAENEIKTLAHRAAYELFKDKILDNLFVIHKCDNTRCINPEHLFLGTQRDNLHDMSRKNRSHAIRPKPVSEFCKYGHKKTLANTYQDGACVTCKKNRSRLDYLEHKKIS